MAGVCSINGCEAALGPKNKSGLCRSCRLAACRADPVIEAKRREATLAANRDPMNRAKRSETMRGIPMAIPMEVRIATGKAAYRRNLNTPEARAKNKEAVAKANKARAEARLFWCDPKYRADYRRMVQRQNVKAADAKRMILELMEADRRRVASAPPVPFAEKLAKVEAGKATLVPSIAPQHLTPTVRRAA